MQEATVASMWAVTVVEVRTPFNVLVIASLVVASVRDVLPAETVFS